MTSQIFPRTPSTISCSHHWVMTLTYFIQTQALAREFRRAAFVEAGLGTTQEFLEYPKAAGGKLPETHKSKSSGIRIVLMMDVISPCTEEMTRSVTLD
ncbi:hypothetical protein Q8A67_014192 [Cirrhinus molitorella]|uniref:Uncharacterized protein n=1 Tax=Cirrhinus molitorella TaxID=172907 RepID=A0AA88PQW7_9TELE|nr:hypothetical protein Q8A67_014192 [Cirrhinus molitorella]